MGTLYIVATPIGNLRDISQRALDVLASVSLIAAEDTRRTRKLLAHFDIKTPIVSYHTFNERARQEQLLEALAKGDVALVSDAGTPAIADPGHDLVAAAIEAGIAVTPIPGASSLTAAVSASGLVDGPFLTLGFLPRKGKDRATTIARAAMTPYSIVIFESPNRLEQTLRDLARAFGERRGLVARELTKIHEELRWGELSQLASEYKDVAVRGEIVIVVAGNYKRDSPETDIEGVISRLLQSGLKPSDAAREAASLTGRARSDLYGIAVEISKNKVADS